MQSAPATDTSPCTLFQPLILHHALCSSHYRFTPLRPKYLPQQFGGTETSHTLQRTSYIAVLSSTSHLFNNASLKESPLQNPTLTAIHTEPHSRQCGHLRTLPPADRIVLANRWGQHRHYKATVRYFIQSLPFLTREIVMYIGFLFVLFKINLFLSPHPFVYLRSVNTLCILFSPLHGSVPLSHNIREDAYRHHTVPSIFP